MERLEAKNFNINMNLIMDSRGISNAELSKRTGIAQSSISEYRKHKHKLSLDNAVLVAKSLNKTVDEMLAEPRGS